MLYLKKQHKHAQKPVSDCKESCNLWQVTINTLNIWGQFGGCFMGLGPPKKDPSKFLNKNHMIHESQRGA